MWHAGLLSFEIRRDKVLLRAVLANVSIIVGQTTVRVLVLAVAGHRHMAVIPGRIRLLYRDIVPLEQKVRDCIRRLRLASRNCAGLVTVLRVGLGFCFADGGEV